MSTVRRRPSRASLLKAFRRLFKLNGEILVAPEGKPTLSRAAWNRLAALIGGLVEEPEKAARAAGAVRIREAAEHLRLGDAWAQRVHAVMFDGAEDRWPEGDIPQPPRTAWLARYTRHSLCGARLSIADLQRVLGWPHVETISKWLDRGLMPADLVRARTPAGLAWASRRRPARKR